jgi:hypothetical protein
MKFSTTLLDYDQASQNTILDYEVMVEELGDLDRKLLYGKMGNYSLAGFQFNLKVGEDIIKQVQFSNGSCGSFQSPLLYMWNGFGPS